MHMQHAQHAVSTTFLLSKHYARLGIQSHDIDDNSYALQLMMRYGMCRPSLVSPKQSVLGIPHYQHSLDLVIMVC
jgi:hypothetical protein